jgi:hypothetical protein
MRTLILASIAGTAFGIAAMALNPLDSAEPPAEPRSPAPVIELPAPHQDESAEEADSQQLASLRLEMSMLSAAVAQLAEEEPARSEPTAAPESAPTEEELRPEQEEVDPEERTRTRVLQLSQQLDAEHTDDRLAASLGADLQLAFEEGGLAGASVSRSDCGATLCRVELSFGDHGAEAAMQLPYLMPWAGEGFTHTDDQGRIVVYAAREGQKLPR